MIRISITPAAYTIVAATLPGHVGAEPERVPNGEFYVWVEFSYVDHLKAMRGPSESHSDVIIRLSEASEGA